MRTRALVVVGVLGVSLVSGGWLLGHGLTGREIGFSNARLFDAVASQIKRFYVEPVSDSALARVSPRLLRDRKSTRLNSSHQSTSRMPSSA